MSKGLLTVLVVGILAALSSASVWLLQRSSSNVNAWGYVDFALFINGQRYDLSSDQFQSTQERPLSLDAQLQDNLGHVVHLYNSDTQLTTFLQSLQIGLTDECLLISPDEYCEDETNTLELWVNSSEVESVQNYTFNSLDQVLLYYGPNDEELIRALSQSVTRDACVYAGEC